MKNQKRGVLFTLGSDDMNQVSMQGSLAGNGLSEDVLESREDVLCKIQSLLSPSFYFGINPLVRLRILFPEYWWRSHELTVGCKGPDESEFLQNVVYPSDFFWPATLDRFWDDWSIENKINNTETPEDDRHWVSARRMSGSPFRICGCKNSTLLAHGTRLIFNRHGIGFNKFTPIE